MDEYYSNKSRGFKRDKGRDRRNKDSEKHNTRNSSTTHSTSKAQNAEIALETVESFDANIGLGKSETFSNDKKYLNHDKIKYLDSNVFSDNSEGFETELEVFQGTTLEASQLYGNSCVLSFGSAKNPGGGFLKGASAQEESLCRASALYHYIKDNVMYEINNDDNNMCKYAHIAIYSPDVAIIKDDNGKELEKPYKCNFITCPAVNYKHAKKKCESNELTDTMYKRVELIFQIAKAKKQTKLILGSFGCGVFGGDIGFLCKIYKHYLYDDERFENCFEKIIFASPSTNDCYMFDKKI